MLRATIMRETNPDTELESPLSPRSLTSTRRLLQEGQLSDWTDPRISSRTDREDTRSTRRERKMRMSLGWVRLGWFALVFDHDGLDEPGNRKNGPSLVLGKDRRIVQRAPRRVFRRNQASLLSAALEGMVETKKNARWLDARGFDPEVLTRFGEQIRAFEQTGCLSDFLRASRDKKVIRDWKDDVRVSPILKSIVSESDHRFASLRINLSQKSTLGYLRLEASLIHQ